MEGFILIWAFGGMESYFPEFAGREIIQSSMQINGNGGEIV